MGDRVNSDHTTPLPIVNRSQSNTTLYIDVSLVDLGKLLCVNLKFGEIFTRWFIFRGGSLVGVNFLHVDNLPLSFSVQWKYRPSYT